MSEITRYDLGGIGFTAKADGDVCRYSDVQALQAEHAAEVAKVSAELTKLDRDLRIVKDVIEAERVLATADRAEITRLRNVVRELRERLWTFDAQDPEIFDAETERLCGE